MGKDAQNILKLICKYQTLGKNQFVRRFVRRIQLLDLMAPRLREKHTLLILRSVAACLSRTLFCIFLSQRLFLKRLK